MIEHHIRVGRTARFVALGEVGPATREVWIVLHGYAQLAEHFIRSFRVLDDGSRCIVAPEALSRFYVSGTEGHVGASWMTKVDRLAEIDDTIGYLDAVSGQVLGSTIVDAGAEPPRLVVLGFSQGAAAAARWACRGARRADAVILWGGMLPPEIDLSASRERLGNLHLVVGTRDEYRRDDALTEQRSRLVAAALPYRFVEFEGNHRIEKGPLLRLAEDLWTSPTTGSRD